MLGQIRRVIVEMENGAKAEFSQKEIVSLKLGVPDGRDVWASFGQSMTLEIKLRVPVGSYDFSVGSYELPNIPPPLPSGPKALK